MTIGNPALKRRRILFPTDKQKNNGSAAQAMAPVVRQPKISPQVF
jgi:hypothetical protein